MDNRYMLDLCPLSVRFISLIALLENENTHAN